MDWVVETFLVLDPEKTYFANIHSYASDSSRLAIEKKLLVLEDSTLKVTETVTMNGTIAAFFKDWFSEIEPSAIVQELNGLLSPYESLRVEDVAIEHLHENDVPFRMRLGYTILNENNKEAESIEVKMPIPWERYFLEKVETPSRINPFKIEYPLGIESRASFQLPDGAVLIADNPGEFDNHEAASRFLDWRVSVQPSADAKNDYWLLNANVHNGHFPASDFEEFLGEFRAVLDVADEGFHVKMATE